MYPNYKYERRRLELLAWWCVDISGLGRLEIYNFKRSASWCVITPLETALAPTHAPADLAAPSVPLFSALLCVPFREVPSLCLCVPFVIEKCVKAAVCVCKNWISPSLRSPTDRPPPLHEVFYGSFVPLELDSYSTKTPPPPPNPTPSRSLPSRARSRRSATPRWTRPCPR